MLAKALNRSWMWGCWGSKNYFFFQLPRFFMWVVTN